MGQSLTSCQTTLIGSTGGDHINGIIWLFTNTGNPYGGISSVTNYPFSENVSQPQLLTSATMMVPAWIIAKIVGPICAWNVMVFLSYMLSALLMYGFIYWLLRRKSVAIYAAIAVAFTPYHYWKTWGHLSYIQSGLFIAILWSYLAFWRKPSKKMALLLGILISGLLYGDGYFPLIGGVLVGTITCYSLIVDFYLTRKNKVSRRLYIKKLNYLLITAFVIVLAFIPLFYVSKHYSSKINSSLSSSRGNLKLEVETYGAHPVDYILPSQTHPIPIVEEITSNYRESNVYSNNGEYHLFIGFVTIALAIISIFLSVRYLLSKNTKQLTKQRRWLIWVSGACFSIAIIALMASMAPSIKVFGIHPIWVSAIVSDFISYWRVFARIYIVLNIAVVTLASIGFWYLLKLIKNTRVRYIIVVLVIAITIIELMPINPFSRSDQWNIHNASPTYWWLRKQSQIKSLAAYPLLESPQGNTYFGDQVIHKKPLLNSYSANDPELLLHRSLSGIGDRQTLGALKTLGIENLIIYRIKIPSNIDGLTPQYGNYGAKVAAINSFVKPINHVLIPDTGYEKPTVDNTSQISCRNQLGPIGSINIRRLKGVATNKLVPIQFVVKGQPNQKVMIYSNGVIFETLSFNSINEVRSIDIDLEENSTLNIGHISSADKGFVAVCNLGTGN